VVASDTLARLHGRYSAVRFATHEDGRDLPILDLIDDPDPRFRPSPALLEEIDRFDQLPTTTRPVYQLDRPTVPLLNACFDAGLVTITSCAGHSHSDDRTPHLGLRGLSGRAQAVAAILAAHLPSARIEYGLARHRTPLSLFPTDRFTRLLLRWNVPGPDATTRSYTEDELVDLDRRVLVAAVAVRAAIPQLPADEPSRQELLLERIGAFVKGAGADLPTIGGARWLQEVELAPGDWLSADLIADTTDEARVRASQVQAWHLDCGLQRRTEAGWVTLWEWKRDASTFAELERVILAVLERPVSTPR
jgi:hypothetical protein